MKNLVSFPWLFATLTVLFILIVSLFCVWITVIIGITPFNHVFSSIQ